MDLVLGSGVIISIGLLVLFRREDYLEKQQRFYERIFKRRLKSVNSKVYYIAGIIIVVLGLIALATSLIKVLQLS